MFIGSSTESRDVAFAIQENLEHDAKCVVWSQGVFQLSHTAVDDLTKQLPSFDFGIFVFAPDDELTKRGTTSGAVRANVLLELGLFIGRLGADRSFVVRPRGLNLDLPTNLLGITVAEYDTAEGDELVAALGPACHKIRRALRSRSAVTAEIAGPSANALKAGATKSKPLPEQPRMRRRVLIGISGASGVGKSTLARALHGELSARPLSNIRLPDQSVTLCESPGRRLVSAGVSADDDTTFEDYALYFRAHLDRLNASNSGVFIFDRTLLDTLAFAEINKNLTGPWLEFAREVARSYSLALDLAVYIPIESHVKAERAVDDEYLRRFDAGLRNVLNHYFPDFVTASGTVDNRLEETLKAVKETVH